MSDSIYEFMPQVEMTQEAFAALPEFDENSEIGVAMRWPHANLVVIKLSPNQYQFQYAWGKS